MAFAACTCRLSVSVECVKGFLFSNQNGHRSGTALLLHTGETVAIAGNVPLQDIKSTLNDPYLTCFDKANIARGYCTYLPTDETGFRRYWKLLVGADTTTAPLLMPEDTLEEQSCSVQSSDGVENACAKELWEHRESSTRCEVVTSRGPRIVPVAALSK